MRLARAKPILETAVTIATGIAAVSMLVRLWGDSPVTGAGQRPSAQVVEDVTSLDLSTVVNDEEASVGDSAAAVLLIEYSDFECPFCAKHADNTFETIRMEFVDDGRVQYVFRNYPIERLHPSAVAAARAATCAQRQKRFMEMRSHLFANQRTLASLDMNHVAALIGLNGPDFVTCLTDVGAASVELEKKEARRLGVSSTPTFFIGRRQADGIARLITRIPGALDYSHFKKGLEAALARGDPGKP